MKSNSCEIYVKYKLNPDDKPIVIKLFKTLSGSPNEFGQELLRMSELWPILGKGKRKCWGRDYVANFLIKSTNNIFLTTHNRFDTMYAYIIDCNKRTIKCFNAEYDFNQIDNNDCEIVLKSEIKLQEK